MVLGLIYRKKELGGKLPYLDGIKMGWVVGIMTGIIGVIFFELYLTYLNPNYLELAHEHAISAGTITIEEADMQFAYPGFLTGMFFFPHVAGILTNAIVGLL